MVKNRLSRWPIIRAAQIRRLVVAAVIFAAVVLLYLTVFTRAGIWN